MIFIVYGKFPAQENLVEHGNKVTRVKLGQMINK